MILFYKFNNISSTANKYWKIVIFKNAKIHLIVIHLLLSPIELNETKIWNKLHLIDRDISKLIWKSAKQVYILKSQYFVKMNMCAIEKVKYIYFFLYASVMSLKNFSK